MELMEGREGFGGKAEDSCKRAEKAEKALKDVKMALKNYSRSAIQNAVARGMR